MSQTRGAPQDHIISAEEAPLYATSTSKIAKQAARYRKKNMSQIPSSNPVVQSLQIPTIAKTKKRKVQGRKSPMRTWKDTDASLVAQEGNNGQSQTEPASNTMPESKESVAKGNTSGAVVTHGSIQKQKKRLEKLAMTLNGTGRVASNSPLEHLRQTVSIYNDPLLPSFTGPDTYGSHNAKAALRQQPLPSQAKRKLRKK